MYITYCYLIYNI